MASDKGTKKGAARRSRVLEQIDAETGEVMEGGFVAYVVPKRQNGFGGRWLAMSQDAVVMLSRSAMAGLAIGNRLGTQEWSVLMCLIGHVEYENHIMTPQAEMAQRIGMKRSNFNKAVKSLVDLGVIEKGPKIGRMVSLKLNPDFGWKGSAKNHVISLKEKEIERRNRMKAAGITGVIDGGPAHQNADEEQGSLL